MFNFVVYYLRCFGFSFYDYLSSSDMDEKSNDNESLIARIQQLEHGMWSFID